MHEKRIQNRSLFCAVSVLLYAITSTKFTKFARTRRERTNWYSIKFKIDFWKLFDSIQKNVL